MTRLQIIKNFISKKKGFFSLDQVVAETHIPRQAANAILDALIKERAITKSLKPSWIYRVNRAEQGQDISLNRMWSVIRNKTKSDGTFTLRDLIVLAGVKRETARAFCKKLRHYGFIHPNKPTGMGVFWMLVKDPGPQRPYLGDQVKNKRQ